MPTATICARHLAAGSGQQAEQAGGRSRSNEFTSNSTSIRLPLSLSLSLSFSIYQLPGKWFALPLRSLNGFPQTAKRTDQTRPKYTVIFSLITLFGIENEGGGQAGGQSCQLPHATSRGPEPLQINFVTFSFPQQNDQFTCHCA